MYNTIHNTLIIGKKIIYLPSCHSTNDIAAELVHSGIGEEGTVVIADNQTGGRGQRGTTWHSEPGQNLMFSLILQPRTVAIDQQFLISQVVALAIYDMLRVHTDQVKIKWPNDIYVSGKKLSGTLIENSIQGGSISHSIVGIGVNINQLVFESGRTSSLAQVIGRQVSLKEEFDRIISFLDIRYQQLLRSDGYNKIREEYLSHLYGFQSPVLFRYNNEDVSGIVQGVAESGQILVQLNGEEEIRSFGLKEIEWVWNA
ncbi:biotin--[acetyl-CoA-carboxylase] ligase [Dyadobacter luteus]|uniref:Biotin--[acetyl-CoA-carboxylase] ligase n=1 Tax=Dyadobacter luteus TaxID=2259619 RepID=A0A3D8YF34_9BACT|nr:biotin--[acetyl-CoA-carboxylase] ligase [Dyadobacter luteus]REA61627.1 biotin--[acetyl-CoA-carboxylase] ligase [Dyadobacter luteus]